MKARTTRIWTCLIAVALLLPALPASGQITSRLKRAVVGAADRELQARIDRLAAEAVRCAITDFSCFEDAEAEGKEVIYTDEDGELIKDDDGVPITDRGDAARTAGVEATTREARPGEGAWANYDFVPGETVLFYEDYEADKVGDFPRRLEFVRGNWEIVEWQGRRLLRNTGPRNSAFKVMLPRDLPERFTIEFETYMADGNHQMIVATETPSGSNWGSLDANFFRTGVAHGTGLDTRSGDGVKSVNRTPEIGKRLMPVRILVDGRYTKIYVAERRVANVPNADLPRSPEIWFENIYAASEEEPLLIGAIRIAEGGTDLYDRLAEEGRVRTHGILFAVNRATIRPESTPTLEEIGTMLTKHPDLRLRIEGHTDSTGEDDANLALSERRAAAVRDYLVETYGIDRSRLEMQGFGEAQPIDDNETPEGRQNNRRVELVRLDATGA